MSSYITNPETGKPIKVGGRTYIKLIKKNLITYKKTTDTLYDITENEEYESDNMDDFIQSKKEELDSELDQNTQTVKGRGVHKGKLVKRSKSLSIQDNIDLLCNVFVDIIDDNKEMISTMDKDELYDSIKEIIQDKLLK